MNGSQKRTSLTSPCIINLLMTFSVNQLQPWRSKHSDEFHFVPATHTLSHGRTRTPTHTHTHTRKHAHARTHKHTHVQLANKLSSSSLSLQDEVNQIMETNLWLRHVSTHSHTYTHRGAYLGCSLTVYVFV